MTNKIKQSLLKSQVKAKGKSSVLPSFMQKEQKEQKELKELKEKNADHSNASSKLSDSNDNSTKNSLKKKVDDNNIIFANIIHNDLIIRKWYVLNFFNSDSNYYSKIFTSLLFGIFSGIIQLQAFQGLILFTIIFGLTSVIIKSLSNLKNGVFIKNEISNLWLNGFSDAAMTFVLFWTLAYNGKWLYSSG